MPPVPPRNTNSNNTYYSCLTLNHAWNVHTCNIDTMTDPSESKKATIPQWQQLKISGPSQTSGQQPTDRETPEATSSRAILLEQASTFLEQDGIKDAPTDKKREFLKTKGLTQEESNTLLELPPDKADAKSQRVGVQEEVRDHYCNVKFNDDPMFTCS